MWSKGKLRFVRREEILMNIADKILKLRKEHGLSQEAFAEKMGVSRQTVSKWESGTAPDTDKIILMSRLFGVSTDYLLVEDSAAPPVLSSVPESNGNGPKKRKNPVVKIVAIVIVFSLLASIVGLCVYHGGAKEAWWAINGGKVKYPYVLVHGLGGWGESEGINETVQYWGAGACDLKAELTEEGYEVYMPSVGPVSSAWDRACELYAQLTGTTVDYGQAHSQAHNHARYGREYTTPIVENWGGRVNGGQRIKINLVGHSFGGATVRLLASLMEYGCEEEVAATGEETSELFKGGKGDWIYSVTALCAPHNGSTLTEVLNSVGGLVGITDTTEMLVNLCFGIADIGSSASGVYDFKLDHFGVGDVSAENADEAVSAVISAGNDHAGYDLSPDGAAKLNETIKTVEGVYYFSFSYTTTKEGTLLKGHVPQSTTLPILYPFALAMGSYTGTTAGGIVIDETWQENDGLVSVVSARYPFNEPYVEHTVDLNEVEELQTGVWNVAKTRDGDHGNVIGLNAKADATAEFFSEHFELVDSLER